MKNKNKPRILCLVQLPPPVHGASIMNNYLVNSEKIKNKYDIDVVNLDFTTKVRDIGKVSFKKVIQFLKISRIILFKNLKAKYEIVYFTISPHGPAFYRDVIFVFILKLFRAKILYHLHGKGIAEESKNLLKKKLYKFVFRKTNVILLSKRLRYDIKKVHYGKIYFVPNGIPNIMNDFSNQEKDKKEIIYLSSLKKSKGVLTFIKALDLLNKRGVHFSAKIVGNESKDLSLNELNNIVIKKNLSNKVKVLGPKYGREKFLELSSSGIFCFPTFYKNECFPLAILEAMMMGLVPVSTYNGAIPEIIDDEVNGVLFNAKDADQLSKKLMYLLSNTERVSSMGQKAKIKFEKNYTIDEFEKNMLEVLNSVLQS